MGRAGVRAAASAAQEWRDLQGGVCALVVLRPPRVPPPPAPPRRPTRSSQLLERSSWVGSLRKKPAAQCKHCEAKEGVGVVQDTSPRLRLCRWSMAAEARARTGARRERARPPPQSRSSPSLRSSHGSAGEPAPVPAGVGAVRLLLPARRAYTQANLRSRPLPTTAHNRKAAALGLIRAVASCRAWSLSRPRGFDRGFGRGGRLPPACTASERAERAERPASSI